MKPPMTRDRPESLQFEAILPQTWLAVALPFLHPRKSVTAMSRGRSETRLFSYDLAETHSLVHNGSQLFDDIKEDLVIIIPHSNFPPWDWGSKRMGTCGRVCQRRNASN